MRRMLINATQPEEVRLAMVDGQKLLNFEIEQLGREQRKGNIYKAVITRIEPSLEACFVNYGEERQGFLPFKEVSREYFASSDTPLSKITIDEALKVGQELMVQVVKEERGNKNAALTTFISLAGRYLVLMPNKSRSGGISRRIEGEERQDLKEAIRQLRSPRGMSLISRTAAIKREVNELQWDLDYLLGLWKAISDAATATKGAFLIYNESALVIRAIRDHYDSDISEILIDTEAIYNQAYQFMSHIMPDEAQKVKFYQDETALFARFQIEQQIESAYAREVKLPSGGSIVLDHTEALVAIDVNSARSTRGSDIEETATNTNLEAADEIARQLRLRDLGGLIVIDFIDMENPEHQKAVEDRLRKALRQDRARVQFSNISRFGLLELSRQRLRPALYEGASISCPRCNGVGHIRDTESTSLQILRRVQEEAHKDNTVAIKIQVPVDVASYLLNKKREELTKIEFNNHIHVLTIPNFRLETPNYMLERLKEEDEEELEKLHQTYALGDRVDEADAIISQAAQKTNIQEPVIKNYMPKVAPNPVERIQQPKAKPAHKKEEAKTGFWQWIKGLFSSEEKDTQQQQKKTDKKQDRTAKGSTENRSNSRRNDQKPRDNNRRQGQSPSTRSPARKKDEQDKQVEQQDRKPTRNRNDRNNRRREEPRDVAERDETQPSEQKRRSRRPNGRDQAAQTQEAAVAQPAERQRRAPATDERQETRKVSASSLLNEENLIQTELLENDQATEEEKPRSRSRRSRDRYGRDRRNQVKANDATQEISAENDSQEPSVLPEVTERPAQQPKRHPVERQHPVERDIPEHSAPERTEDQEVLAAAIPMTVVETEAVAQEEPVQKTPIKQDAVSPRQPVALTPYQLNVDALHEVLQKAGLEWVFTDPVAAENAKRQIEQEPRPQFGRILKAAPAIMETENLILVETQKRIDRIFTSANQS